MLGTRWVQAPELADLFFGITMRLVLHTGLRPQAGAVGLSDRRSDNIPLGK
jgi:hypothetical protein